MTAKKTTKKRAAKKTAKKATKKAVSAHTPHPGHLEIAGPVYQDGTLHFAPTDLIMFELSEAKVANALQAVALKNKEVEALRIELAHLMGSASGLKTRHRDLTKRMEAAYKLDFTQVTYDDVTGRLSVQGAPVVKGD